MSKKKVIVHIVNDPQYVVEQSDPLHQKFTWSYEISIQNNTDEIVQLLHRFWRITDLTGKVEEIHGAGVIGLQPLIKPGQSFGYRSFCQLATPQGTMEGHYEFQNLEDAHFDVPIPKFVLSAPSAMSEDYRSTLH